ncbi:MAG: hypothetical protein ABWW69_06665 [Pyrodictiaceae archaeon]
MVSTVVARLDDALWLVIPKYIEGSTNGLWSFMGLGLKRIIDAYTPKGVHEAALRAFLSESTPYYEQPVPVIRSGDKLVHCSGVEAFRKILAKPDSPLEDVVVYLAEALGPIHSLRLTGSLLLGVHHEYSDVDLVIGNYEDALELVMDFPMNITKWDVLVEEFVRNGLLRGLSPSISKKLYKPWSRFLLKTGTHSVRISISLFSDRLRTRPSYAILKLSNNIQEFQRVRVEPYQESILGYPGVAHGDTTTIVVLDGFYVPALFEGGSFYVKGVEASFCMRSSDCIKVIAVGARERPGIIKPVT